MYNGFEDEIWEFFLKAAVIENSLNEIKDYPPEKEINHIVLPKHYDLIMRKIVKRCRNRQKRTVLLKYGKKIASVIFLIMGISFTALLSFKEVRAACQNTIMYIYEKYIQFDFVSNVSEPSNDIECTYLPDGYYLFDSKKNEYQFQALYKNNFDDIIELLVYSQNSTTYIDNEHYIIHNIQINSIPGIFFESTNINFKNCLTWHTEQGYFRLLSSFDKDIMIKIAENIK